jgi:hypothetical protein
LVLWKVAINWASRAIFAEWDDFGFPFGATTQSGLSSTLPQEGCCGTDQSSQSLLPWVPMLIVLPVTFLNVHGIQGRMALMVSILLCCDP